jgi:hypothetical protein
MSNINPTNINAAYPVAGVDNDSQGFRDNFRNIQTNFNYAEAEISDLQSKVLLKSPLTGTTLNNAMQGAGISGATIKDFREVRVDNGIPGTTVTLDHTTGHYQQVQTNGNLTITFGTSWPPAGNVGRIRLKLIVANKTDRLVLPSPSGGWIGTQYIQEYDQSSNSIGFTQSGTGTYYFEFITDDAGNTISIQDITRSKWSTDYTYANISNSASVSVTSKLILDSAANALDTVYIYFPNAPVDGHFVSVSSYKPIQGNLFLIANSSAGTVIHGNVTTLSGNSHLGYTYVANSTSTINAWFKTQV